jgi:hypothetical protein
MKTIRLGLLALVLALAATGCDAATEITGSNCVVPSQGSTC